MWALKRIYHTLGKVKSVGRGAALEAPGRI